MEIETTKEVCCPNCGHNFNPTNDKTTNELLEETPDVVNSKENPKNHSASAFLWISTVVVIAFVVIAVIITNGSHSETAGSTIADSAKIDTTSKFDASAAKPTKVLPKTEGKDCWTYQTEENKMTSRSNYFASTVSTNDLDLSAPYNGFNHDNLNVRYKDGQNNVFLTIDKGQFIRGVEGTTIRVRFDQHKPTFFECSGSSDYDSRVLFINSPSRFIGRLKKAKKVIIEVTVYQDGNQQLEFDVDGFKWRH